MLNVFETFSVGRFIVAVISAGIIPAFFEELLMRGVVYQAYNKISTKAAVMFTTFIFVVFHGKPEFILGYAFMGWYKEPECINEWDFEKDIVPEKVYVERYIESKENMYRFYEYKETILYAKWV